MTVIQKGHLLLREKSGRENRALWNISIIEGKVLVNGLTSTATEIFLLIKKVQL